MGVWFMVEHTQETLAERPAVSCGAYAFDASSLGLRLFLAHEAGFLGYVTAPEWSLAGPLERPLSDEELVPVFDEMAAARRDGDTWAISYLRRVAILARWIVECGVWSRGECEAAAWSSLVVGLHWHGFEPLRRSAALEVYKPPADFFEIYSTADRLFSMLTGSFSIGV